MRLQSSTLPTLSKSSRKTTCPLLDLSQTSWVARLHLSTLYHCQSPRSGKAVARTSCPSLDLSQTSWVVRLDLSTLHLSRSRPVDHLHEYLGVLPDQLILSCWLLLTQTHGLRQTILITDELSDRVWSISTKPLAPKDSCVFAVVYTASFSKLSRQYAL